MDYRVIAGLFLLLFLGLADNQSIPALLPALSGSLGTSVAVTGLLVVFYSLAAAAAAFLTGSLSDYYGRRRFLLAGVWVFFVASLGSSLSRGFTQLAFARALTGLAAGALSTCSIAFAGDWFKYAVRGRALGLISSAYFVAPLMVPLAGFIADRRGWPHVFTAFAAVALIVALLTQGLPHDTPHGEWNLSSANPDESSSSAHEHQARPDAEGMLLHTLRTFRVLLGRRDTAAMLVIAFLVSGGLVSFLTYIGTWLHSSFGLSTTKIGLVFMLGGLLAVGGAPLGGVLADRWGKRGISIASNILLALTMAILPLLGWGPGLLIVFTGLSLGIGFRQGPITALMTEMVPRQRRGSFVALRNIASQLGIGAAVFSGGLLYEWRGYLAVTSLSALMAAVVALLLTTHITEPATLEYQPAMDAKS
ncbi:MAG TPA: MFS transporter [Terriglobia bacterium]|nr:MFS transporter [Terriglobia bacterium]